MSGDPLVKAAALLRQNKPDAAAPILNAYLAQHPTDVVVLRMLSEAHARAGRPDEAEKVLRRCVELAPDYGYARHSLSQLLMGLGRLDEALAEAQELLRQEPGNKGSLRLLAAVLVNRGAFDEALKVYEDLLAADPRPAGTWMSYGHVLKTVGRTEEGISAYRRAIALNPGQGESYWSLANLKTVRFTPDEVVLMRAQLRHARLSPPDRVGMHYALGKALEDAGDTAAAFENYAAGAGLHRGTVEHDAERLHAFVDQSERLYTPAFFAARSGLGCSAPDPIFIVGLPRSGSTLIEQILASHSAIEGTQELPDLLAATRELGRAENVGAGESYLEALPEVSAASLTGLGERYLRTTRGQRKLGRAFFVDKMPNNFADVGFIHLILPNAKIIDARRHPMACGWSCFKQHFALGQNFTYDLTEIGRYYSDYVRLMAHMDAVLPGRVHRVIHEHLVADPEPHIRALLDYCGLPFEDACLRPHETGRAVRTASSEQVRQPISAKGLDDWRAFEPWLGPLKDALGPVLDAYPDAPKRA